MHHNKLMDERMLVDAIVQYANNYNNEVLAKDAQDSMF